MVATASARGRAGSVMLFGSGEATDADGGAGPGDCSLRPAAHKKMLLLNITFH